MDPINDMVFSLSRAIFFLQKYSMKGLIFFCLLLFFEKGNSKSLFDEDFEVLLKRDTPAWQVAQQEEGWPIQPLQTLYEKYEPLVLKNFTEYKIPTKIHFIWIGEKCFPKTLISHIRKWIAFHPHWDFIFWTDRERPPPCKGMQVRVVQDLSFSQLKHYFEKAKTFEEKTLLLSYEILWKEGGIYIDPEIQPIRSLEKFHQAYDFYTALNVPEEKIEGYSIPIGAGVIAAKPFHPVLKSCMDILEKQWQPLYKKYPEENLSHEISRIWEGSCLAFTKALYTSLEKEGNIDIVFPSAYLKDPLKSPFAKPEINRISEKDKTPFQKAFAKQIQAMEEKLRYISTLNIVFICLVSLSIFLRKLLGKRKRWLLFLLFPLFSLHAKERKDFSLLMGKDEFQTSHIQTPEDYAHFHFFQDLYEQGSLLREEEQTLIPSVFHYVWLGEDPLPMSFFRNMESWLQKHPDFKGVLWTDRPRNIPLKSLEERRVQDFAWKLLKEPFEDSQNLAEKESLLRLEILSQEGGICMHWDVKAKRSLSSLMCTHTFLASLTLPEKASYGSSSIQVSPAILASTPSHPVIEETLHKVQKKWSEISSYFPEKSKEAAGYRHYYHILDPLQQAIYEKHQPKDIILPSGYFHKLEGKYGILGYRSFSYPLVKGRKTFEDVAIAQLDLISKKLQRQYALSGIFTGLGFFGLISVIIGITKLKKE